MNAVGYFFNKKDINKSMNTQNDESNWEKEVVSQLISEQKKSRLSGNIFKSFFIFFVFVFMFSVWTTFFIDHPDKVTGTKHTAVVNLIGLIAANTEASADNVITSLRRAFQDKDTKGVILRCNSPGGAPVQSDNINREIRRLRKQYPKIPIHTVVEDVCASGGYYVASATSNIYLNPSSIVGSVGVISAGFGFTEVMEKVGVERRILTSGHSKSQLDSFLPLKDSDVKSSQRIMKAIHVEFIRAVKRGRGKRLSRSKKLELFSGEVWTGRRAIDLGIADKIGDIYTISSNVIKAPLLINFSIKPTVTEEFLKQFGLTMVSVFKEMTRPIVSL